MKQLIFNIILILACSINGFSQFGADYSSYGFNFVSDDNNERLKGWTGARVNNRSRFRVYQQSDTLNNYALEINPRSGSMNIKYDDSGYMDLNPCSFKILIRVRIKQYSDTNDKLSFLLYTGAKKVQLDWTNDGIYYTDSASNSTLIKTAAPIEEWITYSIALDSCEEEATLMLENDTTNLYTLDLPDDSTPQNINLAASSDSADSFSSEIDHLFIYSNPIKWWLGPSRDFIDDTPAGYVGTTGDRQHFLPLPNGEKIGINENAGGYVTFTELTPGGPNLDPLPRHGSGGTKTIRGFFHTNEFNPVQAGISSISGGHLADVNTSPNKVSVASFPLHNFFTDDFIENTPLIYPNGDTLGDVNHPAIIDDDVYDEFGLDMRHEVMTELDFSTSIENITQADKISTVLHRAEWEYIRHPAQILQFHEIVEAHRPIFGDYIGADDDMGEMRHKFEFRLNYDLGYEWILWKDENNQWQSYQVTAIGDHIEIEIDPNTPIEQRFLVFSTSPDPDVTGAVAWFYPESDFNREGILGKSRSNKDIMYTEDRRTSVIIRGDWRRTNWCRMNLFVRYEGLIAPPNGDPTIYEAFQMEAHQLFGTPNEIFEEVISNDLTSDIEQVELDASPIVFPNPFSSEIIIKGKNLLDKEIKLYSIIGVDASNSIAVESRSNKEIKLTIHNSLSAGIYFLKTGSTTYRLVRAAE